MITLKRVHGDVWRASGNDPQELAQANTNMTGAAPDPESFSKDRDGLFFFEKEIPQLGALQWDTLILDRFRRA